jgi:predicted nucleotidyltransferase
MDKSKALAAVSSFSDAIRATYHPVKVVVYGSYARGDQQPGSDIDVAVIVEEVEGDFLDTVLRTGEVVYERTLSGGIAMRPRRGRPID